MATKIHIYKSPCTHPPIPTHLTITQFITSVVPSHSAQSVPSSKIIFEDDSSGKRLTYGSLRDEAAKHGFMWLRGFGVKHGDVVGVCGGNNVDFVLAIHSVLWAGGVVSLFGPQSTVQDFKHAFGVVKPRFLLVNGDLVWRVREALGEPDGKEKETRIIVLGGERLEGLAHYPHDFTSKTRLPPQPLPRGKTAKETTAAILFSSGTSGVPKAVELSHYALISQLVTFRASNAESYSDTGRCVFFAPLCHIYGFSTTITGPWVGGYMMLMRQFELEKFLKLSERTKANTLLIVPTIAVQMARKGVLERFDLRSVETVLCAGAALEDEVLKILKGRLNDAPVVQGYGMTESVIASLKASEEGKIGSVGRLFAGVEARLVDEDMHDVPPGQIGELLIRGPTLFNGYINNPLATKECFHNNWFKTGDLLKIDNEGFLYYFDRKKEIIKYKAFQISPIELEGILTTHPAVLEAAVCAKWDAEQGTEVPIAYIVLNPLSKGWKEKGKEVVCEKVRKWVDARVAGYKKLRGGVQVIDSLPRTALGKIMRRELPARVELRRLRERAMGSRL